MEKTFQTVSFSALESYKSCAQFYSYRYIENIKHEQPLEKALLVGSWTHTMIEDKLNNDSDLDLVEESFKVHIPEWLDTCGIKLNLEQVEKLIELSIELSHLLYRASAFCNDGTKIRNSNGTVLKSPIDFPSSSLKNELVKLPCYRFKAQLDQVACQQNEVFLHISFTWLFAEALFNASVFSFPKWAEKTIHTEFEFGTSEETIVPIGGVNSNTSLLGYIDWIVKMNDGRIAIIDHKTSSKCPTNEEVLFHPQLNLYAYAYKVLFGSLPSVIGINHIKTGNIILAEVKSSIVNETVEYYSLLYNEAQKNVGVKKHPNDYQSPCVKRDYNSNKVISICPYLEKCWGMYKNIITS